MEMTKDLKLSVSLDEFKTQYERLKQNEEALRVSEERYRLAVEGANDGLWDWDFVTNKFFISEKWKRELPNEILNPKLSIMGKWTRLIHPEDLNEALNSFKEYLKGNSEYLFCEYRFRTKDDYKWVLTRGKILRDKVGKPIRMAGSISDITYRKIYEEKIKDLAYYDRLTKLPNFHYSKEIIGEKIKNNNGIRKFALFLIDLDNFRNINDTLGHQFGDEVLITIKEKLKLIISDNDILCKTGEDEFLIIKDIDYGKLEAENFAKEILNYFQGPLSIHNHEIYSTISIGIEIYPDNVEDAFGLLRNVDSAMYSAKEKGRNTYEFFNTDIYKDIVKKISLESDLRKAIKNNEFELYYQPQMDLNTEEIIGVEALIRWNHPHKGLISPVQFIPLAENTGLIVNIGKWVIETVCKQNMKWQDMGYEDVVISINVSSIQLQQKDFINFVSDALKKYNMKAELLNIEITESTLMKSIDSVVIKLKSLKELGVGISLDDFGTGYSSLSYLKKLPIDTLKIDKIFIDDVNEHSIEDAITGEIIQLAHKMKIDVVAEGVEEKNQIHLLKSQNCDKIQGYVLSKPVPKEEVIKFFKSKL
ncbi:hypothetical protein GCM10008905_06660 [Clostridium malenominatum]|uniref:Uncharacterized protein n=1 Tax=Clostridium malenominatum TaxID=1539 RepID=A0ABP3TW37_9CLOT